jgi:hypothetical protein
MAKQYGFTPEGDPNLPGYAGYNPKEFPGYVGPTEGQQAALDAYGQQAGVNTGYDTAVQNTYNLLDEPGTLAKMGFNVPGLVKGLGHFVRGGKRVQDTMSDALKRRRQIVGKQAYADLNAQTGAAGNMGSSVAGIGKVNLADRYLAKAAEDEAMATQTGEAVTQGRMGIAAGIGGKIADTLMGDWTGRALASQNLANLALQEHGQTMDDLGNLYQMEHHTGQMPQDHAYRLHYGWQNRPDQSSGWDTALGFATAAIPLL